MKARRWLLMGLALMVAVGAWLWSSQPSLHYAAHTLPADDQTLALAKQAGLDTVVQLFSWRQIEPTRGEYHWQYPDEVVHGAEYYGLDLVVRLDQHPAWTSPVTPTLNAPPENLADYADFVSTVASRYRGRVKAYVIWNEPNLAREWGGRPADAAEYVALLCTAYEALKVGNPEVLVVSAGLAPTNGQTGVAVDDRRFLEDMYQAGAKGCFDVLGAHAYGFAYAPDDSPGAHGGLNLARIEDLRAIMVGHDDGDKPVWATELGWTVEAQGEDAWQTVSPQQQADYLVRALQRARQDWPWVQLVAVWHLSGEGQAEWPGYNLLDTEGQPRPAFYALQALDKGWKVPSWAEAAADVRRFVEARWGQPRYPVLAPDTVIHLGDTDFSWPWIPLYGARDPSTAWEGVVYVPHPGSASWTLTLRLMQSNALDNYVWLNGQRLEPAFPVEDFAGSWVSCSWEVPPGWLRPGANRVMVTAGRLPPLVQSGNFTWDDVQIKDAVLSPSRGSDSSR